MQKFAKKLLVSIVSLSIVVMMVPGVAQGATVEELLAQITALQAQLVQLQNQLTELQGGTPAVTGCTITSFDRNLKQTMTGDDVKCLQIVLNTASDTQVATTGAGSPGSETSYFGPLTKAAVVKFQEKYASEVLASWGLTTGTGFVGTTTRAKLNALLAGGVTPTVSPTVSPTPVPGSGLTVALAADTPATGTIATTSGATDPGSGITPLAKFTFSNGDSTDVKVTILKLRRLGISADSTLSGVYLFDGATRLTDAASVSSSIITFADSTGVFTVPAGTTKTITVSVEIATNTSGQTVGVGIQAVADITSNASAVNATFPVNGNLMSIAVATLATVDFNATTTPTVSGANLSITPENDYVVWQNIIQVGNRAVNFHRMSLRMLGSVNYSDLQNFRLYVDGVQVGSTVQSLDSNGYVTFDLSASPVRLETGARTIKLLADIIGGSSRTFSFSLRTTADTTFTDTQYGTTIRPTASSSTFSARNSCTDATYYCVVAQGVVTITKMTDSPSGEVVNGASNVVLGKFEVKASGERVKIESLKVAVDVGGNAATDITLRNGALYANSVQIGSTASLYDITNSTAAYTTYNLGSSLIVEPGNPVTLEVRADIYSLGTALDTTDDTITARIVLGSNNAQGMVSFAILSVPSANVLGNSLTNSTGGLTLSKYTAYPDKSMTVPLTAAKLAHFTLTANTTEAVNLNSIVVNLSEVSGAVDGSDDISNMYVVYGANTTTTKPTVADGDNTWSINYQLASGATIDVIVYANVASGAYAAGAPADTIQPKIRVSGVTAQSATSINAPSSTTYRSGQTITFTTGAFSAVFNGAPLAQVVAGSTAADIDAGTPKQISAAEFKFTSVVDTYTIKQLRFTLESSSVSPALLYAVLRDGSTVLGTVPYDSANSRFYFTGLNVQVPANTTKVLTLDYLLSQPSSDVPSSGVNVKATLAWMRRADSQGVETDVDDPAGTGTDPAGSNIYVYQSVPVLTYVTPTGSFGNGSQVDLYSWKVKADAKGSIAVKQFKLGASWTNLNSSTLELDQFKLYKGASNLTDLVYITDQDGNNVKSTDGTTEGDDGIVITFLSEDVISAGSEVTYTLKGVPSGFQSVSGNSDSVSLRLLGDSSVTESSGVITKRYLTQASSNRIALATSANAAYGSGTAYNFVWSDNSSVLHASTAGAAAGADWFNGYLVENLDLTSKGWTL